MLADKSDRLKDLELGGQFYCSIAFKAASDLRNTLHIDEQAFRQIAPGLWKDPRESFIYRVLDEVQKAGICIHEWVEKLEDDKEKSKSFDHLDRLAKQWLSDEQSFRARKLAEVLVEVICFSATNEAEYYRDYLRLGELQTVSRSLNDQNEFFGFRRRNSEYHADWIERDILAAEKAGLDVSKRWYLKEPLPFQSKWKTRGVQFSSFRQRYIRSLGLGLPTEVAALGKSYVHAYGMSAEIHFTPQEISSDFDPKDVYLGIDRVGLLCFAIVIRCQLLLDVIPEGLNAELRKMHDGNARPADILNQLKTEKAKVGDFVWANGDICEVMEIKKSKYGYVSYLLRYMNVRPSQK